MNRRTFILDYDRVFFLLVVYNTFVNDIAAVFPNINQKWVTLSLSAIFVGLMVFFIAFNKIHIVNFRKALVVFGLVLVFVSGILDERTKEYIEPLVNISSFRTEWILPLAYLIESNPKYRVEQLTRIAVVAMIVKCMLAIWGVYDVDSYMSLGYALVIWNCFYIQHLFSKEKMAHKGMKIIFCCLSCLINVLYGNRFIIVIICAFCLYCYAKHGKSKPIIKIGAIIGILMIVLIGVIAFGDKIVKMMYDITGSRTMYMLMSDTINNVTGRDTIWQSCIKAIKQRPFTGYGIGYDRVICADGTERTIYAHNIFLELSINFGVIIAFIITAIIIIVGYKGLFSLRDDNWNALFAPYYIVSAIQLTVSSSIWVNTYFWCAIFIYLAWTSNKYEQAKE